jgi:hypothetical protein
MQEDEIKIGVTMISIGCSSVMTTLHQR